MKNILLIGAGAVGQVFGYKLARSNDVKLSYFVREKHLKDLSGGVTLYNLMRRSHKISFSNYELLTSTSQVAEQKWDQVHLCISSTALRLFDLADLKSALNADATIVLLQPVPQDFDYLCQYFPVDRIVRGSLNFTAYHAPLPSDPPDFKGMAFLFPPLTKLAFTGPTRLANEVCQAYKDGGVNCEVSEKTLQDYLFISSVVFVFVLALEKCEWNYEKLFKNKEVIKQMNSAKALILRALECQFNRKAPFLLKIMPLRILKYLLPIIKRLAPIDPQQLIIQHFSKLSDQTKLGMQTYEDLAVEHGFDGGAVAEFTSE